MMARVKIFKKSLMSDVFSRNMTFYDTEGTELKQTGTKSFVRTDDWAKHGYTEPVEHKVYGEIVATEGKRPFGIKGETCSDKFCAKDNTRIPRSTGVITLPSGKRMDKYTCPTCKMEHLDD